MLAFDAIHHQTVKLLVITQQVVDHQRTLRILGGGGNSHGAVGDVQRNQIAHFFTKPEEAKIGAGLGLIHFSAVAGPRFSMMLTRTRQTFLHFLHLIAGVVQHVGAPVASARPGLHGLGEIHQLVALQIVVAQLVGVLGGFAVEQIHAQTLDVDVGGVAGLPAAGHLLAVGGAGAVGVPRNDAVLAVLHILEVLAQLFPGMHAVFQPGLHGPVAAVHEAVVGPLRILILGNQVDAAVILAQLPVLLRNGGPGLRGIGFQHILAQLKESALLGVRPGVQPVGGGADQVDIAALGGQRKVVVGGPVGPFDPLDLQFSVHLFGQDSVDLCQHFIGLVGGLVAGDHVGDDNVLGGVDSFVGHSDAGQHHGRQRQSEQQGDQFFHLGFLLFLISRALSQAGEPL